MADTTGAQHHYIVYWTTPDKPADERRSAVLLIDGYSTPADIPRIIAIRDLPGGADDADQVVILAVIGAENITV